MIVELILLNHLLCLPRRNELSIGSSVENGNLFFSLSDVLFLQEDDTLFFQWSDLAFSCVVRSSGPVLKAVERVDAVFVKCSKPFVKDLSSNVVMAGYLRSALSFPIGNDPL